MAIIRPEVLAPVGDTERLEAAILYGADAVYLGGKQFGMRANPSNFTNDELANAVKLAHSHNVRVYLTCNTLPTNEEIEFLPQFIDDAVNAGVDAMIVADIGILMTIRHQAPQMDVHISTQTGIVNYLTANELYKLGAKRVVLARELSLEAIKTIRAKTPKELEIETFVHGAMCMSFSGRCLISNYITGRDANRGECAQPCRWGYHLVEEKRPNQFYPIYEDEKGSYILNAKDMCMIEHIDKLVDSGITSLKIEGRAKSAYYVAVVTNAYRHAVDMYVKNPSEYLLEDWVLEETKKVSHREYSTGFYFGRPDQCYQSGGYVREWDIIANVKSSSDGMLELICRNKFLKGDEVEILEPGKKPITFTIDEIFDHNGESIEASCHPMSLIRVPFDKDIVSGSIVRKAKV
ncbi:MAG: U32 family peptidase [Oscillospiraceae bacterium]